MPQNLDDWLFITSEAGKALLEHAAKCSPSNVTQISSLRKKHSEDHVHVAIEITQARKKAVLKFPEQASSLYANITGLEQSSSLSVGLHKAKRIKQHTDEITDLCCGIGGDSMAFMQSGIKVTAVDSDPLKTWMAQNNAKCETITADVNDIKPNHQAWHLDPARRTQMARIWQFEDYMPGPEYIINLLKDNPDGCLKLGPGVNLTTLCEFFDARELPYEIEIVCEGTHLTQALIWTGKFAKEQRTATLITKDKEIHQISGEADYPPIDDIKQYLYTINPAAERLRLDHLLCEKHNLSSIHYDLGLLTSDTLIQDPFLTAYKYCDIMSWKQNTKHVRKWLSTNDCKDVVVKTRDKVCNPDTVQYELKGKKTNNRSYTLFVHRWREKNKVIITQRIH